MTAYDDYVMSDNSYIGVTGYTLLMPTCFQMLLSIPWILPECKFILFLCYVLNCMIEVLEICLRDVRLVLVRA